MSNYRLPDAYCQRAAIGGLAVGGVLLVLLVPIVLAALYFQQPEADRNTALVSLLFVLPIMCLAGGFGLWRGYSRRRAVLQGFQVILERDEITRVMPGLADLTLFRDEITDLTETPLAGLTIRTADPRRWMAVPAALVDYEELRGVLAGWKTIRVLPRSRRIGLAVRIALLTAIAGALLATFFSMNPYVVVPCGIFLLVFCLWGLWSIQRSAMIDARTKLVSWVVLLPVLGVVLRLALALGFMGQP